MNIPVIIFLCIAGSLFLGFLVIVVMAIIQTKRFSRVRADLPPRPPFRCPACKGEEIEVLSSGLWDGMDKSSCGIFEYGLCKQCGGRCVRYIDDEPYIPTDEQWQSHFGPQEKWRQQAKSWPFDPEAEKPAA
jgi:hypothetical protein